MQASEAPRERRKQQRLALRPTASFSFASGPRLPARCRDISLGGAFLECDTPPLFGAVVDVHLWLPTPDGLTEHAISSTVRWISRDGFGVQFGAMGVRATHALVCLITPPTASPQLLEVVRPRAIRGRFGRLREHHHARLRERNALAAVKK